MAELKAKKEEEELEAIEKDRKRLFKERRLREAQAKAIISASKKETEEPQKASENPLKVRSVRKFMEDQI